MTTTAGQLEDAELAALIADGAGQLLMRLRNTGLLRGRALGKAGDLISDRFILAALQEHRPRDAVLSEETADVPGRTAAERVWIIDPLDGTREYGEHRSDWAVHVALSVAGRPAVGAVALPAQYRVLRSDTPPPLRHRCAEERVKLVVSRSRPPAEAEAVASALGAELVPMGSAGAKVSAVACGSADVYVHAGGQYEWDSCAPVAVALSGGLHATRLDGSPLSYNHGNPYLPDLVVCRPELAKSVQAALAGAVPSPTSPRS